jgi:hypothetical protein
VQVLNIDILSDEMLVLTVTDGTVCTYSLHFDQNNETQEKHATRDVRIIVLDPPLQLKQIKVNRAHSASYPLGARGSFPGGKLAGM